MDSELLIQGCIKNDAASQRELYNRYSPMLLSICYRYGNSRADAEDMLQESFVKIFTHLHTFKHEGNFDGWLKRITIFTCINFLKKNKRFAEVSELDMANDIAATESNIPLLMQAKQVVESIKLLPVGFRTILNLYAIEGYSHREIADMLDIEESTSRSQYSRAKTYLENILIKRRIIEPGSSSAVPKWTAVVKPTS